jgi:hypothetical protein
MLGPLRGPQNASSVMLVRASLRGNHQGVALLEKVRPQVSGDLHPDEDVQVAFRAQTKSAWLALVFRWIIFFTHYRIVVVTTQRILVYESGRWKATQVKQRLRELPRGIRIGPPHGGWYRTDALGETLYIARAYHKAIRQADEVATAG